MDQGGYSIWTKVVIPYGARWLFHISIRKRLAFCISQTDIGVMFIALALPSLL